MIDFRLEKRQRNGRVVDFRLRGVRRQRSITWRGSEGQFSNPIPLQTPPVIGASTQADPHIGAAPGSLLGYNSLGHDALDPPVTRALCQARSALRLTTGQAGAPLK